MKLRVVIADDEKAAQQLMLELVRPYPTTLEIVGVASTGTEAIDLINNTNPDVAFLDIELSDMTGFEVIQKINHQVKVVFVTAFDQFAVQAFEQNAIDYLLKPVDPVRLQKCINKLDTISTTSFTEIKLKELIEQLEPRKPLSAIPVKRGKTIILVACDKISYFKSASGVVVAHCDNGDTHLTDYKLSDLVNILPEEFIRVQKSYIVNSQKIVEVQKYFNNRLILTLADQGFSSIMTGTAFAKLIKSKLGL